MSSASSGEHVEGTSPEVDPSPEVESSPADADADADADSEGSVVGGGLVVALEVVEVAVVGPLVVASLVDVGSSLSASPPEEAGTHGSPCGSRGVSHPLVASTPAINPNRHQPSTHEVYRSRGRVDRRSA